MEIILLFVGIGITVIIVLLAIFIPAYKRKRAKPLPQKKPAFCWLPKFTTTIRFTPQIIEADNSLNALDKILGHLGFQVENQTDEVISFAAGSVIGDFKREPLKIRLTFSLPLMAETPLLVEYGGFAAFDTGDLWKIATEFQQILQGENPNVPDTNAKWISATENQFGIDILDCSEFCQSMVSTTSDPNLATSFVQLRSSLGEQYRGIFPPNLTWYECNLSYPYDGQHKDGPLFKAEEMEDKWDIYLFDEILYFTRSWSGDLVFVAKASFGLNQVHLKSAGANAELKQDCEDTIAVVDYLMKRLLYGMIVPHPLPKDLPNDPDTLALFSFSQYGRYAIYGTYTDTTQFRVPETSS